MASETGQLRRSLSFARWHTQRLQEEVAINEELPCRAIKQPYVFTQVVRDDREVALRWQQRPDTPGLSLTHSQTWPEQPSRRKPRYYSFDQPPTLTRTPWEAERHKRHSQSQWARYPRPARLSAYVLEQLPHEIYSCIVGHLTATYTTGSTIDVSGRNRALRTICLTSKRWAKAAIEHLYRDLWLPSSTPSHKRARRLSMTKTKSQLELLIRTLQEAPSLSYLIRRVHITGVLSRELESLETSPAQHKAACRMLRAVIETCTEVELVTGYSPPAVREYAEWYQLLFSCTRLISHAWMFDLRHKPVFSWGHFADLHERWQWLETLVLCKMDSSSGYLGPGIISAITSRLWSLKHLMISGFNKEDFHNGTLLALKPLRSLRLENLDGITDQGIFQLSQSRNAFSLRSVSLIDLELTSMRTIQILLSNLSQLRRFRFVQNTCPTYPPSASNPAKRHTLASQTLHHLHWDTLISGPAFNTLAHSISTGRLPSLLTLKSPSDPHGTLQSLCRPIPRHTLTASDYAFLSTIDHEEEAQDKYTRSLRLAQLQAQLRIRQSRARPSLSVVVSDEERRTRHTSYIGSYLGDVRSRVEFVLGPDLVGGREALGSLEEVLGKGMEGLEKGSETLRGLEGLF